MDPARFAAPLSVVIFFLQCVHIWLHVKFRWVTMISNSQYNGVNQSKIYYISSDAVGLARKNKSIGRTKSHEKISRYENPSIPVICASMIEGQKSVF
jgi:hypothetical protein